MELYEFFSSLSLSSRKKKEKERYHTYSGKIIDIRRFTNASSIRIYFASNPKRCFWYDSATLPPNIGKGSVMIVHYQEIIVETYTQFWIEEIRLVDEEKLNSILESKNGTRRRQSSSSNESFNQLSVQEKLPENELSNELTVSCLKCEKKLQLSDFQLCKGKLQQTYLFFDTRSKCNLCKSYSYGESGSSCGMEMLTCKSCNTVRILCF
jgi:hypothetical protein